ncbi:hypothetical protein [Aromatoleum aromaticum]|uniref:hypothetical protein n=1 Tax=Aromatoleum aromaticum TaxID=551760 RepID=UPI001459974A|nr:hypothetical protein [Aromatoleum aromaticum]NMG56839.1 hypothetical protein [Aromatoleum aromaticum]
MAYIAPGATAPTVDPILPVVVQFKHYHEVRIETDEYGLPRVVARVKPGASPVRKMRDLPFVGMPPDWNQLCWWYFPKAANDTEAEERGKYFWDAFVTFARGTRRGRDREVRDLLRYVLAAMPHYADGRREADVFLRSLGEALVAHLRVGLDDGPAPGRKPKAAPSREGAA